MKLPEVVDINITGRCNLHCSYCYGPPPDCSELALDDIERALDILSAGGTTGIVLTGGEPLVRDDIIDILVAMTRRGMKVALQTNATLLREKPETLELVDWLCMPLDGSSEQMVASVRGSPANFRAVVGALEWAASLPSKRFRIKIGTVVTQQNRFDLVNIASILSVHGVDVWKCHEIRPRGRAKENFHRLHVPGEEILQLLEVVRARHPKLNTHFSKRHFSRGAYLFLYPNGDLLAPTMESYRSLGTIFSLSDDFDYTEILNLHNYRANVQAAFLDTFINGGEERVVVDIFVRSPVLRRALQQTLAVFGIGHFGRAPIDVRFVNCEQNASRGDFEADVAILVPTGARTTLVSDIKDVLSIYPGIETWVWESPAVAAKFGGVVTELLLGLHHVRAVGTFPLVIDLLETIARDAPRCGSLVRAAYSKVPDCLLRESNEHIIDYLLLTDQLDRSLFRLSEQEWTALTNTVRGRLPVGATDIHAYYRGVLGNKLLHDIRVTARSLVNYLVCLRAFGDFHDAGDQKVRAVSERLALRLDIDAFYDQLDNLSAQIPVVGGGHSVPLGSLMAGLKILLIDDQPEPWDVLFSVCLGAEVSTATSAQEAAMKAGELEPFDLILLDLYMSHDGRPDGLDVLELYEEIEGCPPIIVFSSSESFANLRQINRSKNCHGFIGKVFDNPSDVLPYLDMKRVLSTAIEGKTVRAYLSRATVVEQIKRMADRFCTYSNSQVNVDTIRDYLSQFRSPRNIALALKVLAGTRFFRRRDISSIFFEQLESHITDPGRAILVDLGGVFDSSKLISYVQGDFLQTERYVPLAAANSLAQAMSLIEESHGRRDTLIFLDDLLGLGNQLGQIYCEWLDLPNPGKVDRRHVQPLESERVRNHFKTLRIYHFFLIAFLEGIETVTKFWAELGFQSAQIVPGIVTRECESCFNSSSLVFDDYQEAGEARDLFRRIGEELMESRTDLTPETRKARALGYGGSGKQFAFFYNVPTCTVTALWKEGTVSGAEWKPLFRRRRKE